MIFLATRNTKRHKKQMSILFVYFCVFCGQFLSCYAETIQAELGVQEAWVGQGAPLYITLKATGPFSGTASFDLPEMAQTFFIKEGNPTVGSETLQGTTWMTQRHEIRIYTQQSGDVVIPPIRVRFEAKADFLSEPEPHSGETPQLTFSSLRPTGTEKLNTIVSTTDMKAEQTWTTNENEVYESGDVVIRRVTRRAKDTTGMIFPVPDLSAPDGVRVYSSSPDVQDKTVRGEITAERVDVIKYQFSQGGTFALPKLEFVWWNPDEEKLSIQTLSGKTFVVQASVVMTKTGRSWKGLLWVFPIPLLWLIFSNVRKYLNCPARRARRSVVEACRTNDPKAAYTAVLKWKQPPFSPKFSKAWKKLAEVNYSESPSTWNGSDFRRVFVQEVRKEKTRQTVVKDQLDPLNPIHD